MIRNRVHRLAVTDGKGRLMGLLSSMDIVGRSRKTIREGRRAKRAVF
ncbi:MAG: CBS domain-containing protein [Pirellulales bacterium]